MAGVRQLVAFFVGSDLLLANGDLAALRSAWYFSASVALIMVFLRSIVCRRERQVRMADRDRELARRAAVVEERARIARELHDEIAHSVSMMVVQAGAERRVIDPAQESTRQVLARPMSSPGSRASPTFRTWSPGCGRLACRWSCGSRESAGSCRSGSSSRRSG